MKRILSLIMATLMLTMAFAGCAKNDDVTEPTNDSNVSDTQYGDLPEGIAATAGDVEISIDDVRLYVDLLVPYIQQSTGAAEGWDQIVLDGGLTARDELINAAIDECRYQIAFVDYAKAEGLYTDADADAYFAEYITSMGGEDVINEMLAGYNLKLDSLKKYIVYMGAYSAVIENAVTEEEAEEIFNRDYITAKHVLIQFEGRANEDEALKLATEVYNKAVAGESFEALVEEYNEDPGQDVQTGYTFKEGDMVTEFYEGAMALKNGEVCEPVKTTYGYHVIKRYPNPEKGTEAYDNYIATIRSSMSGEVITDELYNEIIAEYPLVVNEGGLNEIDLSIYDDDGNVNYGDGSVFNE